MTRKTFWYGFRRGLKESTKLPGSVYGYLIGIGISGGGDLAVQLGWLPQPHPSHPLARFVGLCAGVAACFVGIVFWRPSNDRQ